jgi:hypothetical protein
MTQGGTQSRHGSEGLCSVSPIIAILYCRTTGCTMFTRGIQSVSIPFTQQAKYFPTPPRTDSLMILAILLFWVPRADKTAGYSQES